MNTDRKIKICHIVTRLDVGGMENGVINICNSLDRSIFTPIVCCLNAAGKMADRLKPDVPLFDMKFKEGKSFSSPFILARLFKNNELDIVHTHAWGGGSLYGILGAVMARVPIVINGEHGSFSDKYSQVLIQRFLFRLCHANLSVSESLKTNISLTLGVPYKKISVIKNGVDTDKNSGTYSEKEVFHLLNGEGFSFNENDFIIFSIGSLKPEKNQITILQALKLIKASDSTHSIKLLFLGDGPDRLYLTSFVESEGLEDRVFFLGERSDIPMLLSIADILVSTSISRHEGLSNVMLEAMSSGVPVVATKSVGATELITEGYNGFLIEQGDVEGLAGRIMDLYKDASSCKTVGENAKKVVREQYSISKMIQGYEHLYLELMKMNTRSIKADSNFFNHMHT